MQEKDKEPRQTDHVWRDVPDESIRAWNEIFQSSDEILNLSAPCPLCGTNALHRFYRLHRAEQTNQSSRRGGLWEWCGECRCFVHYSASVPDWWHCDLEVDASELTSYPTAIEKAIREREEKVETRK